MKRGHQRIGLGEPILDDERPGTEDMRDLVQTTPGTDPATIKLPVAAAGRPESS